MCCKSVRFTQDKIHDILPGVTVYQVHPDGGIFVNTIQGDCIVRSSQSGVLNYHVVELFNVDGTHVKNDSEFCFVLCTACWLLA